MTNAFASTTQIAVRLAAKDSSLASVRQSYRRERTAMKVKTAFRVIVLGNSDVTNGEVRPLPRSWELL